MQIIIDIFQNKCLLSVAIAWLTAQLIKVFTGYFREEEFSVRKFLSGTGGMPSSHSATVVALLTSSVMVYGFRGYETAASVLLATIVMSDAMGVRYETGKQAKVINKLVEELFSGKAKDPQANLKELIGHTPFQVFVGALLGLLVGILVCSLLP
ncbi:MAG: divergent PAP2 family protein [Ruminococcaceae bacterium]|nr:divergent PAP2 family protein [Oscillospiraceae bacterium]